MIKDKKKEKKETLNLIVIPKTRRIGHGFIIACLLPRALNHALLNSPICEVKNNLLRKRGKGLRAPFSVSRCHEMVGVKYINVFHTLGRIRLLYHFLMTGRKFKSSHTKTLHLCFPPKPNSRSSFAIYQLK